MSKQNKTINFLYEASKLLPNNELYTAIRSRMFIKCSGIKSSTSLSLNLVPRCDACGVVFKDVPPINFIKPVTKPKCYKKLKNGATNNTKYQILSVKKFNKYKNDKQILVTQCKICKKQIKQTLNKVGHTRTSTTNQINAVDELIKKKRSKNMQRKKNREFSGLNKSAVLSVKRKLNNEHNNNRSPKKLKTDTNIINLITPEAKKKKKNQVSTPENKSTLNLNILTPNTINKNVKHTSTPICLDSDVICLDSPKKTVREFKNLNDMFTPMFTKNKTIIEISDSEVQSGGNTSAKKTKKKKNKKNKKNKSQSQQQIEKVEQTPKKKNNNNVVLVAEQSTADKKKKKLNNLSNFLKNTSNIPKPNQNNILQNFLSNFT